MEKAIVNAALRGDEAAFTHIYNHTLERALTTAQNVTKNSHDAFDVVQEAYISLWENMSSINDADKLEAWFERTVRNKAIDYVRSRERKAAVVFSDIEAGAEDEDFDFAETIESDYRPFSPESSVDYSETQRLLWGIVDELPDKQRECILLRWKEDKKISEIAETTGLSESTVKSCLNYGHKKIAESVKKLEKEGTKLYGVTPILFLPFLRWMFGGKTAATEGTAAARICAEAAAAGAATATAATVTASVAESVAAEAAKKGVKITIKRVIAGLLVAGTLTAGATTIPIHHGNTVADYIADFAIAITQMGKPKPSDYIEVYRENEERIGFLFWADTYYYSIPQITIDSPDVQTINSEILENFGELADSIDSLAAWGIAPPFEGIAYDAWLNGDILTLNMQVRWPWKNDVMDIHVYFSVDVSTGQKVDNNYIIEKMNMDEDAIYNLVRQKVNSHYKKMIQNETDEINKFCREFGFDSPFKEQDLEELLLLVTPDENLANITLYYGKDGSVMAQYIVDVGDGVYKVTRSVKIK